MIDNHEPPPYPFLFFFYYRDLYAFCRELVKVKSTEYLRSSMRTR